MSSNSLVFVTVQRFYRECIRGVSDVHAVAVADDLNLYGSPRSVLQAFGNLQGLTVDSGLVINLGKCALLWPRRSPIPHDVNGLAQTRGVPVYSGSFEVLGAPVGAVSDTHDFFTRILDSHSTFFDHLLRADVPVQWPCSCCD